jgi:hypothetical protein
MKTNNKNFLKTSKPGLPVHGPVTWGISGSFCAFRGLLKCTSMEIEDRQPLEIV